MILIAICRHCGGPLILRKAPNERDLDWWRDPHNAPGLTCRWNGKARIHEPAEGSVRLPPQSLADYLSA